MKTKLAIAAVMLALTAPVMAEEEISTAEWCGTRHDMATSVMASRQDGVPMPMVMAIAEGLPAMENMAMEAYSKPRMRYEANKQDVITDFANDAYRICMEENRIRW